MGDSVGKRGVACGKDIGEGDGLDHAHATATQSSLAQLSMSANGLPTDSMYAKVFSNSHCTLHSAGHSCK